MHSPAGVRRGHTQEVAFTYSDGSRRLQDAHDTRRIADRLDERFIQRGYVDDDDKAFIERLDMFFLATADAEGRPQCSYKGGDPGIVKVVDEHTLAFPNYVIEVVPHDTRHQFFDIPAIVAPAT